MQTAKYYAHKTLLEYNITSFPIEPQTLIDILKKEDYTVLRTEPNIHILKPLLGDKLFEFSQKPAFTVCSEDIKAVFYSTKLTAEETIEALSHELAHIRCGHISDGAVLGYCDDCFTAQRQEHEAQGFMREFLAPFFMLREKNIITAEDVQRFFLLSKVNAAKQYADYNRPGVRETDIERKLSKRLNPKKANLCKIMFPLLCVFCLAVLYTKSPPSASVSQPQHSEPPVSISTHINEPTAKEYVITPTGKKYHLPTCRYVKNTTCTFLSKEDADKNYLPCSVCNP